MDQPPIEAGAMNHVALTSANPEATAKFYCDLLGFETTRRPAFSFRGSWLRRREVGVMIHLIHDAAHRAAADGPINTRGCHFAMHTADYDRSVRQLAERRIEFVERVLPDYGYRQVFFRDPDGNVVELGEWPSPEVMLNEHVAP